VLAEEQIGAEHGGRRGEEQIPHALVDSLVGFQGDIDLGRAVVQPHGPGVLNELRIEILLTDETQDRVLEVRVAHHGPALDRAAVDDDPAHAAAFDDDPLGVALDPHIDAAFDQIGVHQLDQPVGASLERINPLAHEVREHDAVGDCRVFERRAVGIGDWLHEEANHVLAAGKEFFKELAGGQPLIVVKIHAAGRVEEGCDRFAGDAKFLGEQLRKIFPVIARREREHRVVEADRLERDDRLGDLLGPVSPAAFDHAVGKTVQRDVKNVAAGPLEPGGHAPQLVVLLDQ
jgi:hypothetical protein